MKTETRINGSDSTMTAVTKMTNGNFGAIDALMNIIKDAPKIDPDNALGGIGIMLTLDTYGIYGTDIYVLYSDICGKNVTKMIACIRACQMGLFDSNILKDACSRQDYSGRKLIPVDELILKVKEKLSNFDKQ